MIRNDQKRYVLTGIVVMFSAVTFLFAGCGKKEAGHGKTGRILKPEIEKVSENRAKTTRAQLEGRLEELNNKMSPKDVESIFGPPNEKRKYPNDKFEMLGYSYQYKIGEWDAEVEIEFFKTDTELKVVQVNVTESRDFNPEPEDVDVPAKK